MKYSPGDCYASRSRYRRLGVFLWIFLGAAVFALSPAPAPAQPVDCAQLAAQINRLGDSGQRRANHYGGGAAQKQRADLDHTIKYARSLGCNRQQIFFLDPASAQCPSLNAQIQQMQASLGQSQGAGDPGSDAALKQQLTERYNAYCRGQVQTARQPRQQGFFEALFGVFVPNPNQNPFAQHPNEAILHSPDEDLTPHGGSQAVCVRDCDGGFFPLNISARQGDPDQLTDLCRALCPNASVRVYTRSPNNEIATAVSLDGDALYSDLPNALKFQKSFDPACTCKPPGQSWAEALLGAERVLGRERERKTDITVTPEKSLELSRPKFDKAMQQKPGNQFSPAPQDQAGEDRASGQAETQEITGPDGVKRRVRIIVPPL